MSSSSFYSDSGITTAEADAVESSKNAAAQSAQDAQSHANTASNKADDANDSAIAAAASASTANNSNVAAVASNLGGTNTIGTVAGNIADVNTVAAMQSDVDTVANATYKGKVETVANATYKGKVETVAATDYKSDVETVAETTYKGKVETVAESTYKTKVEAVAADLAGSNTIGGAVQSATNAATSATNASTSETNAASSESTAATHASNASTHATTASGHADDAEDAKTYAQAARDAAQGHRTQTGQDATAAAASATSASSSASDAASSEANAAADALVASNSADSAKIDANVVKNISSTYGTLNAAINSASSSASQASSSASTASTHATTASGHASTAATHAANLGSVAYQNLTAIAESKSVTAADVFVYDTSKDSDGGAWRNRTQGTSWYNEALNTSTRGATKKFPAVAVIVAEQNKITIYDGDNPSMPMWMVFNAASYGATSGHGKKITALNGLLLSANSTGSTREVDFIKDSWAYRATNLYTGNGDTGLASRNEANTGWIQLSTDGIVNTTVNDIAVTVLPNAPIDPETGLPVPTIAVATDGGVSVIKDDGSVYDVGAPNFGFQSVEFRDNLLFTSNYSSGGHTRIFEVDEINADWVLPLKLYEYAQPPYLTQKSTWSSGRKALPTRDNEFAQITNGNKLTLVGMDLQNVGGTTTGKFGDLAAYVNSSYNTGWMNGDTKLATLMDTTAENISAPNLVTNSDLSDIGSNLVSSTTQSGTIPYQGSPWRSHSGSGQFSISNNVITVNASSFEAIRYDITTSNNKAYKITFDLTRTSGDVTVYTHGGAPDFTIANISTSGTHTVYYTNDGTQPATALQFATSNLVGTLSNFKVEEVTGWDVGYNSTLELDNGKLKVIRGAGDSYTTARQTIDGLTIGKTYYYAADVTTPSNQSVRVQISGIGMQTPSTANYSGTGTQRVYDSFVANGTQKILEIMDYAGAATSFLVDNVEFREVVADRSVNANGLNIVGNVTKSAVATGAELVGYSGFSSSNYLQQPYNSDLDFGTGDFCLMGWISTNSTSVQCLIHRGDGSSSSWGTAPIFQIEISTVFKAGIYTAGFSSAESVVEIPSSEIATGNMRHVVVTRSGGYLRLYVDGILKDSAASAGTLTNTNANTWIGERPNMSRPWGGSISLMRWSATAPTAEQIAKIYRDEKPLFQEGAKCTLVTNDTVNAIAYDEDTELLHVGNTSSTASTRDVFSGLQRVESVNRDTYHTNTAISAVNGLVVEE